MKILVTGASGFIGSFAVLEGLQRGYDVYAGIRSTSSRKYLPDGITTVELSLGHKERLMAELTALGRFDYIIHNAGVTKCNQKTDFDKVNHRYTRNFVEALIESDTIPQKFLFVRGCSKRLFIFWRIIYLKILSDRYPKKCLLEKLFEQPPLARVTQ